MEIKTKTIENDEEFLRQRSKEVDFNDKDLKQDIEILKEYCKNTECFAFAAVQIGIPKRIVYLKNTDLNAIEDRKHDEARILINPVILSRKGYTEYWETCLSCLDNMGLVKRPYEIRIKYFNENGSCYTETFSGFKATVLSHELDHLDGILHIDIADEVKNMPKEERKKFRIEHGYRVVSRTCDYDKDIVKNVFEVRYRKAHINALRKNYEEIVNKYNDKLLELFKKNIDIAIEESKLMKLDPFDTYIYVNKKIEDCYSAISLTQGKDISQEPDLHDKLIEKIYLYIKPITEEAKNYLKIFAESVYDSESLKELNDNYAKLQEKICKIEKELKLDYHDFDDVKLNSFQKRKSK